MAIGALLLSILVGVLTHSPTASLFATPLHPEQLAEVQEQLAAWNLPFTPTADNVVVPSARRNETLLRLSLAGVPHAHVERSGEALANVGVLTPQAVIDAQTNAGLAGDIEAGLRGIDGVDDALVIVAPAKPAEFADESAREAGASVRLTMRAGAHLSREAVEGIRAFVAASVPGLDASRVTILDDRGIALGGPRGTGGGDVQRALQSALDRAFGSGSSIVRVHTDYDVATQERREVQRLPAGGAPISSAALDESYGDGGKQYRRRDDRSQRGSDVRENASSVPAGGVARVSTAVFVDRSRGLDVVKVRELAAAVVGFDARRGDLLVVQAVAFGQVAQSRPDPWWLAYGVFAPLLPTLAMVCGVLAGLRIAVPPLARALRRFAAREPSVRREASAPEFAPERVRGALAGEPPYAAAAIISALPAATAAAVLELYPAHEREAILRRIQRRNSPLVPDPRDVVERHA